MSAMHPNQEMQFRETTAKHGKHVSVLKTRWCPACKRARSIAQFVDGKKNCAKCRGVKVNGAPAAQPAVGIQPPTDAPPNSLAG